MENDAILQNLFSHYPELKPCEDAILAAFGLLAECYDHEGAVYTCGNGGSCADCEHIAGELMKAFVLPRRPDKALMDMLNERFPADAAFLTEKVNGIPGVELTDIYPLKKLPQEAWMREIELSDKRVLQGDDGDEAEQPERAILVGIDSEKSLDELAALAQSAGAQVVGAAIVWLFNLFTMNSAVNILNYLYFSPYLILHGQVWRLLTFIIIPPGTGILTLVAFYFYYFIGRTLEQQWGPGKFTIYFF